MTPDRLQEQTPAAAHDDPGQRMLQMMTGYWISQLVHGAAYCSLADHLHARSLTATEMAAAEGLDPRATFRFLRACASIGLVAYDGDARFSSTPLLGLLRKSHPGSLRGMALMLAEPGHWLPWGRFADVLKTGESQTKAALGSELFDYYARTPAEAENFSAAMSGLTAAVALDVVGALDLNGVSSVVDVGGANGALLIALLKEHPQLRGIIFDRPNVIPGAEKAAADSGLADRVTAVGGDFFTSVPAGDLYLIKYILHDWDDANCLTILRNCQRAMNPGGRVAVIELVLGEIGEPGFAPLMDINMMVLVHGRERSFAEYHALLEASGFGAVMIMPTNTPMAIIEARVA